ncbi:unnamed protein product [Calicophoron daubneyi]|uniref:K Homology domain-containing protein n=1 Tax=Calicophoron daubneyi TaxID=300641 RepID=A0AAV2TFE0_CALDB
MSANFIIPNNGLPQSVVPSQQPITAHRTRAISACSAPRIPICSQYHQPFSQQYRPVAAVDAPWAHPQAGVYVNGVGKLVNVYPGPGMSELDDTSVGQTGETYKYAQGMKLSDVSSQPGNHLYQPPIGTLPSLNPQVRFAVAPNRSQQSATNIPLPVGSLPTDSSPMIHPPSSQALGQAPSQSVFVHGLVGQQNVASLAAQSALSPSLYTGTSVNNAGVHNLGSYSTKQLSSVAIGNEGGSIPTQLSANGTSVAHPNYVHTLPMHQHSAVSHAQLFANSGIQPTAAHLTSSLPPGVVEFLPAVYTADPNANVQFSHQPTAMFGHYTASVPAAFDPTMEMAYTTRVRHNTWGGLESNTFPGNNPTKPTNQQPVDRPDEGSLLEGSRLLTARNLFNRSVVVSQQNNSNVSLMPCNASLSTRHQSAHRPGVIELPSSVALINNSSQESSERYVRTSVSSPSFQQSKTDACGDRPIQWGSAVSQWSNQAQTGFSAAPSDSNGILSDSNGNIRNASTFNPTTHCLGPRNSPRDQQRNNFRRIQDANTPNVAGRRNPTDFQTSRMVLNRDRNARQIENQFGKCGSGLHFDDHISHPSYGGGSIKIKANQSAAAHTLAPTNFPMVDFTRNPNINLSRADQHSKLDPFLWQNLAAAAAAAATVPLSVPNEVGADRFHRNRGHFISQFGWGTSEVNGYAKFSEYLHANSKLNNLRCILDACPTRILIGTTLVGAVIGRGGRTIQLITSKTGASIDFRPGSVAFSQFSVRGRSRSFLPRTSVLEKDKVVDSEQSSALSPAPTNANVQSNVTDSISRTNNSSLCQSQVVFLTGSREQCSAAVNEMLSVCFRESEHKGFSTPCLGLLVPQRIYDQLVMGRGRKYFGAICAATGARVSVTGSSDHAISNNRCAVNGDENADISLDRILVVRGELSSICAAEAYISEQVRFITAEMLVPPIVWPLLPHLPVRLFPSPPSSNKQSGEKSRSHSKQNDGPYDLQTVIKLLVPIASVFWPSSVCAKLMKHPSLSQTNLDTAQLLLHHGSRRYFTNHDHASDPSNASKDLNGTETEENEEVTKGPKNELEPDSRSQTDVNVPRVGEKGSNQVPTSSLKQVSDSEQKSSSIQVISEIPRTPSDRVRTQSQNDHTRDNENKLQESVPTTSDDGRPAEVSKDASYQKFSPKTPHAEVDPALAAMIQQAIITAVGPAAWLATNGMLFMRVSYNEAGVLIGTGGTRIRQIMQSTGAGLLVGKTPISGPYALNQALRHTPHASAENDDCESIGNAKPLTSSTNETTQSVRSDAPDDPEDCTAAHTILSDTVLVDTVTVAQSGGCRGECKGDSDVRPGTELKDLETTDHSVPPTDLEEPSNTSDLRRSQSQTPTESSHESVQQTKSPERPQPSRTPNDDLPKTVSSGSSLNAHRLVTLSGPLQSQLMAQWRIFQRIKLLRHKEAQQTDCNTVPTNDHNSNPSELQKLSSGHSAPTSTLCLASLLCLPYQFLCWLTSTDSGFSQFMSSLNSLSSPELDTSECGSPLSWLQSLATKLTKETLDGSSDPNLRVIHVLPEPRRRRRLLQQQLRRSGLTKKGQMARNGKPIMLPSTGLTNDGLDALWSDPNRVPVEIYADYEITQIVLGHLHRMLALWLYGQSLTNPKGLNLPQPPLVFLNMRGNNPKGAPFSSSLRPGEVYSTPMTNTSSVRTLGDWGNQWSLASGHSDFRQHQSYPPMALPVFPHSLAPAGPIDCSPAGRPFYCPNQPNLVRLPTDLETRGFGQPPGEWYSGTTNSFGRNQRTRAGNYSSKWQQSRLNTNGTQENGHMEPLARYPQNQPNPYGDQQFPVPSFGPFSGGLPNESILAAIAAVNPSLSSSYRRGVSFPPGGFQLNTGYSPPYLMNGASLLNRPGGISRQNTGQQQQNFRRPMGKSASQDCWTNQAADKCG